MSRETVSTVRGSAERKVLMICHAFPPTGGPGVQRSAKFAKYLPKFGWLPTVWTADAVHGLPGDPTLTMELPREVVVHAHRAGSGVQAFRRSLRGFLDAGDGARLRAAASQVARALDWRLQSWLASAPFPDDCAAWARRSVRPVMRIVEGDAIDLLYSTFSPASNHLLALEVKRRSGLPWVADFRDLWTDDYRYREASGARRSAHRQLEQEILECADVVVGVTPTQTEILARHVTNDNSPHQNPLTLLSLPAGGRGKAQPLTPPFFAGEERGLGAGCATKFITITNGFDPDDFEEPFAPALRDREDFVIAYVGRLDAQRTNEALWDGLRAFVERLGTDRERVLFRLVGHVNTVARGRIAASGLRCEFDGYVPHADAIRTMRGADALLLIAPTGPNCETVIAAKVFEYLAARRPIVLVGPRGGECERIVRSCLAGVTAPFDAGRIAAALARVFAAWKAGRPLPGCNPSRLHPFSRVELTRRLAGILDRLIEGRGTGSPKNAAVLEALTP